MKTVKGNVGRILFWLFMILGIFSRVWQFGEIPGDINIDEAYAGYEAYSLLHYGMDSHGYRFPVYLTTWGSGMSALNSYLMIPFLAIFGAETWVIRIPQMLVGCLTLVAVYSIVKRIINIPAALCSMFLLAIAPWHIMLSRWGLDANLAPGFLLFGLCFFLKGFEKSKYFIVSAIMYGLSLYCYATIWPFVPLMLVLQLGYALIYKKLRFSKELLISGVVLFLFAVPLLLFLAVNFGWIEEICLPFISIPKLLHMRANEFSFDNIYDNMKNLWHIVKLQNDWHPHNVTQEFGIFYHASFSFFVIGLFVYLVKFIISIFKKEYCSQMMILIQLGGAVLLGLSLDVNINRVNILFIPMIIIAASGVYYFCQFIGKLIYRLYMVITKKIKEENAVADKKAIHIGLSLLVIPLIGYIVLFVQFEKHYFTDYANEIEYPFCKGIEDAVDCAVQYEGTIYVSPGVAQPRILFYSEEPVTEYLETIEYQNYPSAFLYAASFGRFNFVFDETKPDKDAVYILSRAVDLKIYEEMGFTLETFDWFTVAHID